MSAIFAPLFRSSPSDGKMARYDKRCTCTDSHDLSCASSAMRSARALAAISTCIRPSGNYAVLTAPLKTTSRPGLGHCQDTYLEQTLCLATQDAILTEKETERHKEKKEGGRAGERERERERERDLTVTV